MEKKQQIVVLDPPVYTVEEFCKAHHIARSYFYALLQQGKGPKIYKVEENGRRTYIRGEAAAEWRRQLEAETTANPPTFHLNLSGKRG